MQLKEFIKSLPQGLDTALFQKENSCHRLMLKKLLLEVLLVDPRFYFMKTLQTTWMTKLPIIDFITAKNTNGPLLYHQKISTESKCNRNITLKNGQIILDLKNN
jgi:hypothetical protein